MSSNRVELKKHVPYVPDVSALHAARGFYAVMRARRSVRMFSDKPTSSRGASFVSRTPR